jgi:hypothetical protein
MKILIGCLIAAAAVSRPANAQEKAKAAEAAEAMPQMEQVYLVLLRKGPVWSAEKTPESAAIQ